MRDAVVIGASAGGIVALQALLRGLPRDLPAAVLAVLHIPAQAPSSLPLILSSAGALPAKSAEDGEAMTPGKVFVAPPDCHLVVDGARLRLTRGPRENRVRPCVDTLFRSAAVDLGPRVIGIVLSGALDDGTAGLWAVKDRGGLALVQKPSEAEFPDMPTSACTHVDVDYVLPAAEIGRTLAALTAEEAPPARPRSAALEAESRIEREGPKSSEEVLGLGRVVANTCPECNGALIEIRDGPIVRYMCHTGHAYSLRTLLAETEVAIEASLWRTICAVDERVFLLRKLEHQARDAGDAELADRMAADAAQCVASSKTLRRLNGPCLPS